MRLLCHPVSPRRCGVSAASGMRQRHDRSVLVCRRLGFKATAVPLLLGAVLRAMRRQGPSTSTPRGIPRQPVHDPQALVHASNRRRVLGQRAAPFASGAGEPRSTAVQQRSKLGVIQQAMTSRALRPNTRVVASPTSGGRSQVRRLSPRNVSRGRRLRDDEAQPAATRGKVPAMRSGRFVERFLSTSDDDAPSLMGTYYDEVSDVTRDATGDVVVETALSAMPLVATVRTKDIETKAAGEH